MKYNLRSFKRYQREYEGAYLSYGGSNDVILDRIYEMASEVKEGEELFNENTGMYETECEAIWEEIDGNVYSFVFTKAVPYNHVDKEINDLDEDGNFYLKGYRSHLDGSFIPA